MADNVPTPSYPCIPRFTCGCKDWREDFKTDCFYYSEDIDMGAIIPWCSHEHTTLEAMECNGCKNYISKREVYEVASQILEERRESNG